MLSKTKQAFPITRGDLEMRSCNNVVTKEHNTILCKTEKQQNFLERARQINLEEQRGFCYADFPDYSLGNFRAMIHKLRDKIQLMYRSPMGFYKVKGVSLPNDIKLVTNEGTSVGLSMIPILRMVKEQPATIHDLKFKFDSKVLHEKLKSTKPVNPHNQSILLTLTLQPYVFAKMLIYPNTVQVDLGCSSRPIIYDVGGAISLTMHLGRVYQYLVQLTENNADFPLPQKWIVTHYHFGKDGREGLSGPRFERTFEDVLGGIIRFYSKIMPNGKVIPRIETIVTPHRTLDDEIQIMISQEIDNK